MAKLFYTIFFVLLAGDFILSDENNEFAVNNQKFSVKFYSQIFNKPDIKGKSFVFSPYSIQTAGALLYGAAGGKTATEMVIGFNLPSSDAKIVGAAFKTTREKSLKDSLFKMANKIYVAEGYSVAPTYYEIAVKTFGSDVENINFSENKAAAQKINSWISDQTAGHINDIVPEDILDSQTKLMLVNAIHFKGQWQKKFEKSKTKVGDFYSSPTEKIQIEIMHTTAKLKSASFPKLGVKAAQFPFKDSDVSMFFLLPDSVEKSLDDIEANLNDIITKFNVFKEIENSWDGTTIFSLPKFKINYGSEIREMLQNLGMPNAFGPHGSFENLLSSSEPLSIQSALHKASIECDEEGAEAAAATVVQVSVYSAPARPKVFNIEQSFLYFIKDSNDVIFFMGRFTGK